MPTDDPATGDLADLIDVCQHLADLQHRLAGQLHAIGLLTDNTRLSAIAHADQTDAHIDDIRRHLTRHRHVGPGQVIEKLRN